METARLAPTWAEILGLIAAYDMHLSVYQAIPLHLVGDFISVPTWARQQASTLIRKALYGVALYGFYPSLSQPFL
jgi:hypothetical protein